MIHTARLVRDGEVRRGTVTLGLRGTYTLTMRRTGQDRHGVHTADLEAVRDGAAVHTTLRLCCVEADIDAPWEWRGWPELGVGDPWQFQVTGRLGADDVLVLTFDEDVRQRRAYAGPYAVVDERGRVVG